MVELIVENESLDLYPSEVISLTMAVNDMASIESREGNYSNKFKVPSTSRNNSIFGYPNELNFITGFKPTKSRNARIVIDGLDVQRGFIQVEQFNQNDRAFSVSFFSGNTDWLDEISDKNLRDIALNKYNHTWNATNVAASFSNTEGYIYPFLNYGRYNTNGGNNTTLETWFPAMFSHTLIRQMFADVDWKVAGNLFSDPVFLKHVLPFSLKNLGLDKETLDLLGVNASISSTYGYTSGNNIIFDRVYGGNSLNSYNNATGVYTSNALFDVDIYVNAVPSPPLTGAERLELRVNGGIVASEKSGAINWSGALSVSDTVTVTMSASRLISSSGSNYVIKATGEMSEGVTFPMASSLPDMSQEAFLQTIFNQFGVVFTSDNISKTIYLNKFEAVKDNIPNAIDWTNKLDVSRNIEIDYTEIVSDYSKSNIIGYKENVDSKIDDFSSVVPTFGGNGSFDIDNDFLSKEDELFESDFVSSYQIPSFNGRTRLMYIPRYKAGSSGDAVGTINPLPRCGICVSDVSVSDLFSEDETSLDINGDVSVNVTDVPYVYFDVSLTGIEEIDSINQCLSFGDNSSPKAHRNLIETYYEDFTSMLNNPRRVTAYFLLNERDINNLDFLTPIYLGGELNNYFFLNRIKDYRPNERGVTKVELILIV